MCPSPAKIRLVLSVLVALALSGCAGDRPDEAGSAGDAPPAPEAAMDAPSGAHSALGGSSAKVSEGADEARRGAAAEASLDEASNEAPGQSREHKDQQAATAGMYIIRKAQLTLQVKDVRESIRRVGAIVSRVGGLVADSEFTSAEGDAPRASLTLRVPAKRFDALLDEFGGVGTIFERRIESEDVTLSYIDTESRIRNLRQEEATLRGLLARSGKLTDVLAVERELSRVTGEIEQAQGRLRHLGNMVSMATIQVTLSEKVKVVSTSPWGSIPEGVENTLRDVERALAGVLAWLANSAIWLVAYVLPLSIPIVGAYAFGYWLLRRWLVQRQAWLSEAWFARVWLGLGAAGLMALAPGVAGTIVTVALVAIAIGSLAWLGAWLKRTLKPGTPAA